MVSVRAMQEQQQYYDEHLQEFVREHPGEYVVICEHKHTFCATQRALLRAHPQSKEIMYGTPPLIRKIPTRYRKPESLMTLEEKADVVHREATAFLRELDVFERKSRKIKLRVHNKVTYGNRH